MNTHFYVIEHPVGEFHVTRTAKLGTTHGRNTSSAEACERAKKLKRDFLSPAHDRFGLRTSDGRGRLVCCEIMRMTGRVADMIFGDAPYNVAYRQKRARRPEGIAIANDDDSEIAAKADDVIRIPKTDELLSPVLAVVPLQLLAYHIADRRGNDVDQPRNLAKAVTVE